MCVAPLPSVHGSRCGCARRLYVLEGCTGSLCGVPQPGLLLRKWSSPRWQRVVPFTGGKPVRAEYLDGATMDYHPIRKLEFELPQAICRHHCLFCANYGGQPTEPPLTREESVALVEDFAEMGGEVLVVTGGEPLECPFAYEIMRCAHRRGLSVVLYSAGYLVDEAAADALALVPVEKVYITILGEEETHDRITGSRGSYSRGLSAISLLSRRRIAVGINFIPMKPNYAEWRRVFSAVQAAGAQEFRLTELMPQGRAWENRALLELDTAEYRFLLEDIAGRPLELGRVAAHTLNGRHLLRLPRRAVALPAAHVFRRPDRHHRHARGIRHPVPGGKNQAWEQEA